jgi:hypothetical protein
LSVLPDPTNQTSFDILKKEAEIKKARLQDNETLNADEIKEIDALISKIKSEEFKKEYSNNLKVIENSSERRKRINKPNFL